MFSVPSFDPADPAAFASPARKGWRALVEFRFEIVLCVLLLATFAAVRFQDALLARTIMIEPRDSAHYAPFAHGDAPNHGNSTTATDPRVPLRWQCRLRPAYAFPYCSYQLLLDTRTPERGVDLSTFDTLTVDLDYAGPWDTIRIHLKNFDPRYTRGGNPDLLKFNKVEASVRPGRNLVTLPLIDFGVAEWWITQNHIRPDFAAAQFDNITRIEFQTGTMAPPGTYRFRIHRITLRGRWIGQAAWYGGILGVWAVLIGLYLGYRIVALREDLERRRQSQAAALRIASHAEESARRDYLTKLLNRAGIIDLYHALAMNRCGEGAFAAILLDVDHFKTINDRFGHSAGDAALAAIAAILQGNVRAGDIVGRWGGEEFLLICTVTDQEAALHVAEKLRAGIEAHEFGSAGKITASLGVYCRNGPMEALEQIVSYADAALYAAKEQGRNRVVKYQAFMRDAA